MKERCAISPSLLATQRAAKGVSVAAPDVSVAVRRVPQEGMFLLAHLAAAAVLFARMSTRDCG